ncbi:MAG: ATP-binding cassette domain-containing protein [Candidatus Bathyarchaeota archaeon]|nr:ATP-binding cassette domain-containing protein [Candidatus Bathyarchaeota archaeon]
MLEVQNVSFSYGDQTVVEDVSFSVRKGECLGLLGPNGAGKTTLTKLIVGLLQPKKGRTFINGIDVQKEPEKTKPLIGICFQESIFYQTLTGKENLEFVTSLYNVPHGEVNDAVSRSLKQSLVVSYSLALR